MTIKERREKIIQKIQEVTDPRVLKAIEIVLGMKSDWADDLTRIIHE